jgi:hypothetical protein
MTEVEPTDGELVAIAEAAYELPRVQELLRRHDLVAATSAEALRSFLIDAGKVYLIQKRDQDQHQRPSALTAELKRIHDLAFQLSERLEQFAPHVHDFKFNRLQQQLPFGGLGPSDPSSFREIEDRYQPGAPEYELSRQLEKICGEHLLFTIQSVSYFSEQALELIDPKKFGGRPSKLALNRWADNVRNFWVKGMKLPFVHSMEGEFVTSTPALFCIDAMALLDEEPTKANITTAVRYARDSGLAWERQMKANQTGTSPDKEG